MLDDAGGDLPRPAPQTHLQGLQINLPRRLRAEEAFDLFGDFGVLGRGQWSFFLAQRASPF